MNQPVVRVLVWAIWIAFALFLLVIAEGSFGHDGLLCELGIDGDGAGTGDTACG